MFQFAPWPYLLGQVSREIVVEPRVFSRKNKQEAAGLESKESKEKKHIFYEQTGLYMAFFSHSLKFSCRQIGHLPAPES